jgi:hypothetical protein
MDTALGYDDLRQDNDPADGGVGEAVAIGGDERRMHVRAYNHWVSLLRDRPFPAIGDLEPESIADFGPHSVLLDFTGGVEDPSIQFIGRALREECAVDLSITRVAQVPARSLLSRLTDHYLQIIANRAPIGFEAEFVGTRGHNMMYRGILMPFSSDRETIDFIYGVINWKEMVAPEEQAKLDAEVAVAVRAAPRRAAPVWADGPSAGMGEPAADTSATLADRLADARDSAAGARTAATRSHAALYRALSRAHDFAIAAAADPQELQALLDDAGIRPQARAPMTAIAKLVFGADYDKTRLTEAATVLAHAGRTGVAEGMLARVIEGTSGGIKAIVAQERAARRRPAAAPVPGMTIATRPVLGMLSMETGADAGSPVVLLGRATAMGIEVIGSVGNDRRLADRVLRRLS